ncbi:hypothetical protein P7C70_g4396, partial [Phenoliferia sp. Uapishka_3]
MTGTSFLDLLRTQYLKTLRSVDARWKILVVDEYTHKMLFSLFTTYDVLDTGIQQIDIITNQRGPQSHLPCIYLLMPTSQNVELVLRDYAPAPAQPPGRNVKKDKHTPPPSAIVQKPKYAAAHLHFVDGIDDRLVTKLTNGLPDNYLAALTELYTNFHGEPALEPKMERAARMLTLYERTAIEPRTFSLETPQTFHTLYAPPDRNSKEVVAQWQDEITWMSRAVSILSCERRFKWVSDAFMLQLVNVLATLGEYPLIRYYSPPTSFHAPLGPASATGEHIGKALALRVQAEIDRYARDNSDFPPEPNPPRPRGVLFITDRSMDLYAPFLHEFTYQAMINDLLEIGDGQTYKYRFRNAEGQLEEKEAVLSNEDNVWNEVKHMHMKDALDKLIKDFKEYAGEHGQRAGGSSLNDMKDMLASLPQLKEAKEKLTFFHFDSSTDKLRIIATYIMHRDGVPEGDKKRLYQHARLALHEMDAIDNLTYLGVNVSKDSGKKRKALFKQREEPDAYDISRYQPSVKYMLEEHFAGRLDQSIFPYVKDAPVVATKDVARAANAPTTASLRSLRADWATKGRKVQNEPRQRVIVFVAGGATYSEVRAVYKVSESTNKDVFLGSTAIITPEKFVEDLSNLDRGGGGAGSSFTLKYDAPPAPAPKKQMKQSSQQSQQQQPPSPSPHMSPDFRQNDMDRRFPTHTPEPTPPPPQQQQRPQQLASPQQSYQQQQGRPSSTVSQGSTYKGSHTADPVQAEKNGKLKKKLFSGKLGF